MDELCKIGQELWDNFRCEDYDENKYKKYVDHIKECDKCKKGLEIDELIDEKELVPIDD